MTLLEQYLKRFKFNPPKLRMTSYESPIYQNLLKQALENNQEITDEMVEEAFEGINIDIKLSNEEDSE